MTQGACVPIPLSNVRSPMRSGPPATLRFRFTEPYPAFAERHARIEVANGQVLLRSLAAGETTVVNGEAVRDAVLRNGDQIVFDAHQRFVLEAPGNPPNARDALQQLDDDPMPAESLRPQQRSGRRLPWLLLAALLLAAGLSGILLFGSQV